LVQLAYNARQGTGMIRLKVREVAIEKGFSMSRLSREANMAYKTIQTIWRKPDHEVTTTTLDKLSKVLGVTPADLIEYVPDGKEEA
jgi:DNA-binding Xre family transcriptional regulator